MNDTITILITGTSGIILAGVSYVVGHVRGFAEYRALHAPALSAAIGQRDALQAELTRLTDRDEHGRYVRNESEPIADFDPVSSLVGSEAWHAVKVAANKARVEANVKAALATQSLPTPVLAAAPKRTRKPKA